MYLYKESLHVSLYMMHAHPLWTLPPDPFLGQSFKSTFACFPIFPIPQTPCDWSFSDKMIPNPRKRAIAEDENEQVDFGVDHKVINCSPLWCHGITNWTAIETQKFAISHFADRQTYPPFLSCPATTPQATSYTSSNSRSIIRWWCRITTSPLFDTPLSLRANE